MVTLRDVALEAGVSATTASAALRGLPTVRPTTRRRVSQAATRIGYRVNPNARALRSGKSGLLALIVLDLETPSYPPLARCFTEETTRHGFQLLVQQTNSSIERERKSLDKVAGGLVDGFFLIADRLSGADVISLAGGFPGVLLEDCSGSRHMDAVNTPSHDGARAAVRHLADRGCRRIGIVGGRSYDNAAERQTQAARDVRIHGALTELADLGMPAGEDEVIASDWSTAGGIEVAHALATAGTPYDGLFCMNDSLALGVLRGFADTDVRVPDDVSVIGFDGVSASSYSVPTLSTIEVDLTGMAKSALALLMSRINDGDDHSMPQTITSGFTLVERQSTAVSAPR